MKKLKRNEAITLVALVVTIVVLLILAGITLVYVFGDNSIFELAQDAKGKTDQAKKDEQDYFSNVENTINQYVNGNGGGSNPVDRVDVATITNKVDKNTPAKDSLENPITIPEGFKVVPDGQDGVEYTYTGDKKPTVQDGIVIEDEEGNQFVWIPVGEIRNKDNTITTITLGRYTFGSDGTPNLEQAAYTAKKIDNYTEVITIENNFQELETPSYGNTVAKSLSTFVSKTKSNGGYYLARYEASEGTDDKVKSKSAEVWNSITQSEAAVKAREMYTSTSFESDLVNSYAWDTAIVFIQTYSGENDYSKQTGVEINFNLVNTGTTTDKKCNIYDMASNTAEWTTETSTIVDCPCVNRGGIWLDSGRDTAGRSDYNTPTTSGTSDSAIIISFRPLLYVK